MEEGPPKFAAKMLLKPRMRHDLAPRTLTILDPHSNLQVITTWMRCGNIPPVEDRSLSEMRLPVASLKLRFG